MKITDRDKLIIKWFGLFLVLVGIVYFGISPLTKRINTMETERQILQSQMDTTLISLAQETQIKQQETEAILKIQERFDRYILLESAADVEATLLPLLRQYAIEIDYFGITPAQVIAPVTTLRSYSDASYKLKTLIDDYSHTILTPTVLPQTDSQLIMVQVTYILGMSFDDYQSLSDDIDALERALWVSKTNYVFKDSLAELTFDIYMSQEPQLTQANE